MKFLCSFFIVLMFTGVLHSQTDFSLEHATATLETLSIGIGPRPMGSPAEHRALTFAVEKFREYGCDTSYIMKMEYTTRANTTSGIAIGIKRGATNRIILIGGHMDSAGPEIPGADDDGSGAATVIELARIFGKRQMQSTLMFCCWGGEEQGLEGSQYFTEHFEHLDSIVMMLQIDMANGLGIVDLDPDTHGRSAPRWLTRAVIEEFYNLGYRNLRYPTHSFSFNYAFSRGAGSDHESFLNKGIPAIDFSTDVDKPIHTPRDNFENVDPRGMQRTGDVFLKLIERFDKGVPNREMERYWLYLIGITPVFVPLWGIWVFIIVTIFLATAAFIVVRRRREPPESPRRIRWSGLKMIPLTLIIVACGWLSSDIISLVKGLRHPWYASLTMYYFLAATAMLAGSWIAVTLGKKMRLSQCPYVFYKRAAFIIILFLILLGWLNIKLAVEPTVALFLISFAILVRNPLLKFLFVALSPWWMLRLMFPEWDSLLIRSVAESIPFGAGSYILYNGIFILFFSLYLLPFFYAFTAVVRDAPSLQRIVNMIKSKWVLGASITACAVLCAHLLSAPSYNNFWYRSVRMIEQVNLNKHSTSAALSSSEYLSGIKLEHGGIDTMFDSRTIFASIAPRGAFDTTWLYVERSESRKRLEDTTRYDVNLSLHTKMRPYTVNVTYSSGTKELRNFSTHWKYTDNDKQKYIDWYSFPDTMLNIPVTFDIAAKDSVREKINVVFDILAYPMEARRELTYVIPRTTYTDEHVYKR